MGEETKWEEYKRMDNSRARSCLLRANWIGRRNAALGEIGDAIRRYRRGANMVYLRERRHARYHEVDRVRRDWILM